MPFRRVLTAFIFTLGALNSTPAAAQAEEPPAAAVVFELTLSESTDPETGVGRAEVVFHSSDTDEGRAVEGWSYALCAAGVELLEPLKGADLERLSSEGGLEFCEIKSTDGTVTVNVLLTAAALSLRENDFHRWRDLVVPFRCPGVACENRSISVCEKPPEGFEKPVSFVIEGTSLPPAEGGRRVLPLCSLSESLSVDPVFTRDGRVTVFFRSAFNIPSCAVSGWSYGVCLEGDVEIENAVGGSDTENGIGGQGPVFEILDTLPGRGVVRAVVLDFMQGVAASAFEKGWEDLVLSFKRVPCGVLRICDKEIGDPPVDAVWNNTDDSSLDMIPERRGSVQLCWKRGDVNFDGRINVADAINVLSCLFLPESGVWCACTEDRGNPCFEVFNVNADERLDVADPVFLLTFIFKEEAPPPALP